MHLTFILVFVYQFSLKSVIPSIHSSGSPHRDDREMRFGVYVASQLIDDWWPMHHEMRQGIIVLGVYPCFTSGKDNEKTNTFQIFPDYFIKTLLWGLTPAVSFQKILYLGAWPQHLNLISGPDPSTNYRKLHWHHSKTSAHCEARWVFCLWGLAPALIQTQSSAKIGVHHYCIEMKLLFPGLLAMMRLRGLLRALWSMILISLVCLKHHNLAVKQLHDIIKCRVRTLNNQSHIIGRFAMLNLGSLDIIVRSSRIILTELFSFL